ncbi:MAG TPA: peptidoglycan editing factor PgeF [Candidatus Dependentiae bacterium]|nr:peptidoglycan editing factor PgeF [Candidatus Dependentiae bacterium]HRQ62936.1 peptidoglycan editing factor PgeF [Candidatus Dependentiae bacterium]
MLIHKAPLFHIYFGNKQDNLNPQEYLNFSAGYDLFSHSSFAKVKKILQLKQLIFLHQVHSAYGEQVTVPKIKQLQPFVHQGDFLITNVRHVGIGVVTADCLPIVLFDTRHYAVGIAHAGWKGSVQSIAVNMTKSMQETYGTNLDELQIFFGPSAQVCCYQVGHDFVEHLESFAYGEHVLQRRENGLYFDLPQFNRLQLEAMGIKKESIHMSYALCTICDKNFCSSRRKDAVRQMTVVSLK